MVVWHVSLKRKIRIAAVVDTRQPETTGVALLFSTDIDLDAEVIVQYYRARFQIEFIFRDAKQFMGLCDTQTRQPQTLDFHFNASLSALNLAKYEDQLRAGQGNQKQPLPPFSMASYKRVAFNNHLLERFISTLYRFNVKLRLIQPPAVAVPLAKGDYKGVPVWCNFKKDWY